jgi:hypothetical protein
MTGMVPGLHENTRPQRKGRDGAWAVAPEDAFEPRDAPPKWVGVGLAGTLVGLLLCVATALGLSSALRPRAALHAETARAQFQSPAPALETAPPQDGLALESAHPAPSGPALEAAMEAVESQGWGNAAPPPSRADTAINRAESGQ